MNIDIGNQVLFNLRHHNKKTKPVLAILEKVYDNGICRIIPPIKGMWAPKIVASKNLRAVNYEQS